MNGRKSIAIAALAASTLVGGASLALAQYDAEPMSEPRAEVSILGGLHVLNENDTALPDQFLDIPVVASVSYRLTPILAVEGEFTWMIPVKQEVDLGTGTKLDRKTPDIVAYQANLRANWPRASTWTPYVAGGLGAVTFLSNDDADRVPQLDDSETMFALNFGGGLGYDLSSRWALRGDFRELVAFPSDDAAGFSDSSGADPIWMERATVGISYRY